MITFLHNILSLGVIMENFIHVIKLTRIYFGSHGSFPKAEYISHKINKKIEENLSNILIISQLYIYPKK